jgi:hypothetical protein
MTLPLLAVAIVEEIATLASLVLFVGMVAIWALGDCNALSQRGRHELRGRLAPLCA